MQTQILLFPGFDELDAFAPYEVLHMAAASGADLQTEYVTLGGAETVTASHGTRVCPQGTLNLAEPPHLLIVPGGGWNTRSAQGAWAEAQRGDIPKTIAALHGAGVTLVAVCTGAMLLAAAGLIQGRPATTHHGALEELRASGADIVHARVVDDGDVVTAGGITSGLDLALWLVERFFGAALALDVEQNLEYERRGTVWRRASSPELTL